MDHADAVPIAELLDERRYLLDVAYWMLGSPGEAESVVDETYRRWYELSDAARKQITAPRSWLAKTAGGICLGRLALPDRDAADQRNGARTETGDATAAQARLEKKEEVSRVLLNALDSLSPAERAAFVLNDVFGMTPDTVADIVGRTEPECVALADRARRCLRTRRSRLTTLEQHEAVARAVGQACATEDVRLLASLLCPDATAFFDGGGKVRALVRPVHGNQQVARSLLTLLGHRPRTTLTTQSVNGRTGLVARYDHRVAAVISFDIADHYHVAQVWVVLNPDKLQFWNHPPAPINPSAQQSPSQRNDGRS
ncbi:sigma factor-like helix-turn-helix DNA-binding protein [Streptomyces sp. AK02-01A]|uniref:sigma factor-like helix-turn-helix DNA-binding protein n=1 Tax=Streptomyces sp. AK02-01A TaxID=3028648 RepID=UPI0029A7EFF2|nr:sigma factor-like helix-turn-helix DNA-binding protein [Streptomyces sp. AK02-01A]MDX3853174.1 sigma factor-like helix-turn-helix DNA-binding protein [Streptomyces sp. AK02-01A]